MDDLDLDGFFNRPGAPSVAAFARDHKWNADQLRQWRHGTWRNARPNAHNCVQLEKDTGHLVSRRKLRPEDWWLIWPELVDDEHPVPAEPAAEAACPS